MFNRVLGETQSMPLSLETVMSEGRRALENADHAEIRRHIRYDMIIVDEAQDLSENQFEIIMIMKAIWDQASITLVGDVLQSIYGFQDARPDLLLQMASKLRTTTREVKRHMAKEESAPTCSILVRNVNRRCSPSIVALANKNIASMTILPEGLDLECRSQWEDINFEMVSAVEEGEAQLPHLRVCRDVDNEVVAVRRQVLALVEEDLKANLERKRSIVVLHRTRNGLTALAQELLRFIDVDINILPDDPSDFEQTVDKVWLTRPAAQVQLRTVHGSKGGTWDVVLVAGLNDQTFPSGLATTAREQEEERRLLHVAITRARRGLYLFCNIKAGISSLLVGSSLRGLVEVTLDPKVPPNASPDVAWEALPAAVDKEQGRRDDGASLTSSAAAQAKERWRHLQNSLRDAFRDDRGPPTSPSDVAKLLHQLLQDGERGGVDVDATEATALGLLQSVIAILVEAVVVYPIGEVDENFGEEAHILSHLHSQPDIRALERGALALIGSMAMSDLCGLPRRIPLGIAPMILLPPLGKKSILAWQDGRDAREVAHARRQVTEGHARIRGALCFKGPSDDLLRNHGYHDLSYRKWTWGWDFFEYGGNGGSKVEAMQKLRPHILGAWGKLLSPRNGKFLTSSALGSSPTQQASSSSMAPQVKLQLRWALQASTCCNGIMAARLTAPPSSRGNIQVEEMGDVMDKVLPQLLRIVRQGKDTTEAHWCKVAATSNASRGVMICRTSEAMVDSVAILAMLLHAVRKCNVFKQLDLSVTSLLDQTPNVACVSVTKELYGELRRLLEFFQSL